MTITSVTHRGIRWQRDSQGRIRWRNEDQDRWVRWRPGDDAPPRPEGWEPTGVERPPPLTRPSWRSPYRVVPVVLVVIVVGLGLFALRGKGSSISAAQETAQAEAFSGRCLPKVGTGPNAGYGSTPVACDAPTAAGKVVAVVTWEQGHSACPAGTVAAILTPATTHNHFECIQALAGR